MKTFSGRRGQWKPVEPSARKPPLPSTAAKCKPSGQQQQRNKKKDGADSNVFSYFAPMTDRQRRPFLPVHFSVRHCLCSSCSCRPFMEGGTLSGWQTGRRQVDWSIGVVAAPSISLRRGSAQRTRAKKKNNGPTAKDQFWLLGPLFHDLVPPSSFGSRSERYLAASIVSAQDLPLFLAWPNDGWPSSSADQSIASGQQQQAHFLPSDLFKTFSWPLQWRHHSHSWILCCFALASFSLGESDRFVSISHQTDYSCPSDQLIWLICLKFISLVN